MSQKEAVLTKREMFKHDTKRKGKMLKTSQKYNRFKPSTGSKEEGQGFANKRKEIMQHKYHRLLKKNKHQLEKSKAQTQKIYGDAGEEMYTPKHRKRDQNKVGTFHKEEKQWKKRVQTKEQKTQEIQEKAQARKEALQKYKKDKRTKHRKLAKKNYKGQPNMAARMELLLQKIQASKS